jgi:hypothetical protein
MLQRDPDLRAEGVVAEYQRALAAGDVDAITATFESDGYAPRTYRPRVRPPRPRRPAPVLRRRSAVRLEELLAAIDVVGGAGERRVRHDVDGKRGDVLGSYDPADRQRVA